MFLYWGLRQVDEGKVRNVYWQQQHYCLHIIFVSAEIEGTFALFSVHCSLSFGYHIPLDLGHHDAGLEKVRSLAIFLGRRDLTGLCSIAPALLQLPPLLYIALGPCFYLWELLGTSWTVPFYFTLQILFLTIPRTKYGIYCIVATACFISCLAPSFCLVSLRQATIPARTWAKELQQVFLSGMQNISATARTDMALLWSGSPTHFQQQVGRGL